jgi:tRNA threonylcarbamoyladenosine biosynthesis protein TsaE
VRAGLALTACSTSAATTQGLAAGLAALLVPTDVVLLSGDLGAGKTTFTQGLARGLGVTEPVTSPTFTLVRAYDGRWADGRPMRLLHADVYRLDHLQEIVDLGLAELVEEGAAAVVEWGEAAAAALAPDYLEIHLSFGEHDDHRLIRARPVGARWETRRAAVGRVLDPHGPGEDRGQ